MYNGQQGYVPQQQFQQSPYAQQVAGGNFPFQNRIEVVGQIFPTQSSPQGFKWVEPKQQGKEGHAEITLKVRKSWNSRKSGPGVKQSKFKLVAYGQLGQTIMNQLRPGMIIRAIGELNVSTFQANQGNNAGQWITNVNIEIRDGRNGEIPIEMYGVLPIQDESRQAQQQSYGAMPAQGQFQQAPAYPQQSQGYPQAQQPYPQQAPGFQQPPAQPQYPAPGMFNGQPAMPPAAYQPPPQQANQFPPQQPFQQPPQPPQYSPQPQPAAPGMPTGTFLPTPQGAPNNGFNGGPPINPADVPF